MESLIHLVYYIVERQTHTIIEQTTHDKIKHDQIAVASDE